MNMTRSIGKRGQSTRNTRQKRAIVARLEASGGVHVTAEGLCAMLRDDGNPVGQATVYRVLKTLETEGMVKRLFVSDNAGACYQYVGDRPECNQHYHLVCESCGGVLHVESRILERFIDEMHRDNGFSIDRKRLSFYGRCGDCGGEKE